MEQQAVLGEPRVIISDPMLILLVMRKWFILSSFTYFKFFRVLHPYHRNSDLHYQAPEQSSGSTAWCYKHCTTLLCAYKAGKGLVEAGPPRY